jgi:hypothetical protein
VVISLLEANKVNAAYVDPAYIAGIRKELDLDQRQAAQSFYAHYGFTAFAGVPLSMYLPLGG